MAPGASAPCFPGTPFYDICMVTFRKKWGYIFGFAQSIMGEGASPFPQDIEQLQFYPISDTDAWEEDMSRNNP